MTRSGSRRNRNHGTSDRRYRQKLPLALHWLKEQQQQQFSYVSDYTSPHCTKRQTGGIESAAAQQSCENCQRSCMVTTVEQLQFTKLNDNELLRLQERDLEKGVDTRRRRQRPVTYDPGNDALFLGVQRKTTS